MDRRDCFLGVKDQVIYETIELFRQGKVSRQRAADLLSLSERTLSDLKREFASRGS